MIIAYLRSELKMTIVIGVTVALGIWFIMWAIERVFEVKHPVWSAVMIILAAIVGFGLLLNGAGVLR